MADEHDGQHAEHAHHRADHLQPDRPLVQHPLHRHDVHRRLRAVDRLQNLSQLGLTALRDRRRARTTRLMTYGGRCAIGTYSIGPFRRENQSSMMLPADADDGHPAFVVRARHLESSSDGVLAWPQPGGERLADDRDRHPVRRVSYFESPALTTGIRIVSKYLRRHRAVGAVLAGARGLRLRRPSRTSSRVALPRCPTARTTSSRPQIGHPAAGDAPSISCSANRRRSSGLLCVLSASTVRIVTTPFGS